MHIETIILRKSRKASTSPITSACSRTLAVRALPGQHQKGIIRAGSVTIPCALGNNGISARKREGDNATPLATMRPLAVFFRADRRLAGIARARLPCIPIRKDQGWCDAPGDRRYNKPVRIPYPASHEKMLRADRLYDVCIVLDWNIRPAIRHRGSAIFMHIARPGMKPTEGCIALQPKDIDRLLPLLSRQTRIKVLR